MHSILFVLEDASFISYIEELLRDCSIRYFFARTEEEAIALVEYKEIAAAMISLSFPSVNAGELMGILKSKNERLHFLLLFEKEDTRRAIFLHNQVFFGGLFCKDMFSPKELLKQLEAILLHYDEESEHKRSDDLFLEKERNCQDRMLEVSALLNDRMESYREIIRLFRLCGKHLLDVDDPASQTEFKACILHYQEQILEDFVRIYLLREPMPESFFVDVKAKCNNPEMKKYFTVSNDVTGEIEAETFQNITFLLSVLTSYFNFFYSEYRGRVFLSEYERFYLFDILYELKQYEAMKKASEDLMPLNEKLISSYAAKAAYGSRGDVIQYKIYFAKPCKDEG